MPDKFGWPTLPAGARWLNEDEAAGQTPPEAEPKKTDLTWAMGPPKPEEPVTFTNNFLIPTAKKVGQEALDMVNPVKDPVGFGLALASTLLPGGPAVKLLGKVGAETVPLVTELGMSPLRRILSMTGAGAAISGMAGQSPIAGGFQGLATQIGGEAARKLTQFAGMNAQARQLANDDPIRLGAWVSQIVPNLPDMKTPRDFHAAFLKGGAQAAASQTLRDGMAEISQAMQGQQIPSKVLTSMRTAGPVQSTPAGANRFLSGLKANATYSFDDIANTIQRLHQVGWTDEEMRAGLGAKDARQAADELSQELVAGMPPTLGDKWSLLNGQYSRFSRLKDFLGDPKLLATDGSLSIPRLQQKLKQDGYSTRGSLALAQDAADLEKVLFRGSGNLAEDIPGEPGKIFGHGHKSWVPLPRFPKVGSYTGTPPPGLTPFQGSVVGQVLRKGIGPNPNPLVSED